jgi:hypothetical protein
VAETKKPAPAFDGRILAVHNRERQDLGLEPLSWNPALADVCPALGRLSGPNRTVRACAGKPFCAGRGKSLGRHQRLLHPRSHGGRLDSGKAVLPAWRVPGQQHDGRVEDIGHYTQVIWRATREVGCAEAASANEDILVCRYAEAGNYRGEQPF